MDNDTLDELERVAREATPGEWSQGQGTFEQEGCWWVSAPTPDPPFPRTDIIRATHRCADAAYIATFDPPTILALIAAARQQETVISDEVVEEMCVAFWEHVGTSPEAMRAALSLLPRGEGSSRSQPPRTTQESPSPTPCDLEWRIVGYRYLYPNNFGGEGWRFDTEGREINGARPLRSEPVFATHRPDADTSGTNDQSRDDPNSPLPTSPEVR